MASYASYNKMTFSNLAILVGPNIFPIDSVPKSSLTITRICDITKVFFVYIKGIFCEICLFVVVDRTLKKDWFYP